jgi:L-fucose mutarotase
MLKGIDPLLGPELLAILRAMGHGDEIVIADANFPAAGNARRLVRLDGVPAPRVLRAILSVLPLDDFVPHAATRMDVSDAPGSVPPAAVDLIETLQASGYTRIVGAIERDTFYARAREAYAIVATGEPRFWGNLILTKGTIPPAEG